MKRRFKLMTSLSALTLAVSACGAEGEGEGEGGEGEGAVPAGQVSEGEGAVSEGEGEGEGEGVTSAQSLLTDDISFLHQLALVRGHLRAFAALHEAGANEMAMTHAKHPQSELYTTLIPGFEARDTKGFADELSALVTATGSGGDIAAAYQSVLDAIAANEPAVGAREKILSVARLLKSAGEEYEIGVADDGSISNLHEYQDAYGFVLVAKEMVQAIDGADSEKQQVLAKIELALDGFKGWIPETASSDASAIFGAMAYAEISALALQ